MNDLILQDSGALAVSERERIRIAAAWEALSVNSRRSYQGAWEKCGQCLAEKGLSLEDLSDELMAVYIATLDAEGRTPATVAVSVAAVKCVFRQCAERGTELADNGKQVALYPSRLKDKGTRTSRTPDL